MQHAHVDAALPGFTERLIHLAVTQRWPVLILVTHTKAELAPTLMTSERSFAGVLAHAREGLTSDPGPAAGLPGGYLTNESFAEIDLRPIADLSTALREELPGLISVQSAAILEHIGGNPRFLEQVIAFLRENENYFEDFNFCGPLTPVGLDEILKETRSQEIFKIVLRRLRNAPEGAWRWAPALCLPVQCRKTVRCHRRQAASARVAGKSLRRTQPRSHRIDPRTLLFEPAVRREVP